ncbi:TonB-dependent siderophore receptor [Siccirubricoccus phaeus]|uniref:TonB-dependent siderophore receptor n=1 Tax=Siccirubricoccus phaeus TaxID=2595053 RepID=UPI00165C5E9E|nr:TonB-dependent siderophore receptor [Siccirubricoccus phaeus]
MPLLAACLFATPAARAQTTRPEPEGAVRLPELSIQGQAETATGPVRGYVAERSAAGTKTDTPLLETPQSVSIVTRDQMDAQRPQTIRDALAYTPGIVAGQGFSRSDETFVIRGFQGSAQNNSIFRDGLRWGANNYGLGLIETYGLERIEVLRGPASILFGAVEPGGILNLVSKRPTATPLHEIELSGGSYGHRQVAADFGGPLTADGSLSYRLTGLWRDSGTMIDHIPDDRRYIAPALTWRPSADTSITLLGSYYRGDTAYNYGYPFNGTVLPNRNGPISTSRFVGQPGFDSYETETFSIGWLAEHRFDATWTVRQNFRYLTADSTIRDLQVVSPTSAAGLSPDQRSVARSAENRRTTSTQYLLDNQVEARFATGPLSHTVLAGFDFAQTRLVDIRGTTRTGVPGLDLYAPNYHLGIPVAKLGTTINSLSTVSQLGLYLQDQVRIADRLVLLLGGRQDWASTEVTNRLARSVVAPEDSAFSGRVGLVWLLDGGFAPYASYSESFIPNTTATVVGGGALKPSTGQQYEVGIRWQPPGARSLVSLAAYELTKQNVVGADVAHPGFATQTGEIRARGVELEGRAELSENFSLIASYAYTDARIMKSSLPAEVGRTPAAVPMHRATLWGDATVTEGPLRGLGLGAGVRYSSGTRDTANLIKVPDVGLVDAMARYDFNEQWRLSLNATNLFDKQYVATCTYACFYGERLTITAALRYRW